MGPPDSDIHIKSQVGYHADYMLGVSKGPEHVKGPVSSWLLRRSKWRKCWDLGENGCKRERKKWELRHLLGHFHKKQIEDRSIQKWYISLSPPHYVTHHPPVFAHLPRMLCHYYDNVDYSLSVHVQNRICVKWCCSAWLLSREALAGCYCHGK